MIMNKTQCIMALTVLCFVSMPVRAQYTSYEDTIGMYPYFYYYNWPNTGIYHEDSVYCNVYAEQGAHGPTSLWAGANWPDEYAVRMHADDTLHVIGIACSYFNKVDTMYLTLYDSAMNELTSTGFYQRKVLPTPADTHYHLLRVPGCPLTNYPYNNRRFCEFFWFALLDGKDGNPVDIIGDFYIGVSMWSCYGHIATSQLFWFEGHQPPYYFPGSDYRLKFNGVWDTLEHEDHSMPHLFPIIDPRCVSIDSVTVVADSAGCLTVRWDSLPTQSQWVVSFGPEGTEPGEGETDTVSERQWRRCGLQPDGHYTVSVRSRCEMLYHSDWSPWSDVWTVAASGNGGSDPEDPDPEDPNSEDTVSIDGVGSVHAELTPNPATGHVRVSCGETIRMVEVYDLQGRRCLALEAVGTSLDLDISTLAAGRYTVIVHTAEGSGAKALVVQ